MPLGLVYRLLGLSVYVYECVAGCGDGDNGGREERGGNGRR
jgi:hypothetical protein